MPRTVISDTSILILFSRINHLELLKKVYSEVITTPEIAEEFGEELPNWIKVQPVSNKEFQEILELQLDLGEASAIALAKELKNTLLLLDDLKARKLANRLNLKITGTLGIIHKAKQLGFIDKVKPVIQKILDTDFRISQNIIEELLTLNNEN
ncbi:DUF3368 domain-containing protein [Salegentibacter sp. JZCK2]|uniref:DUF3368 domain-containing protein n=1 Tax=Salegentibacter tibetensis TaxID=2873600 RepID=UPI001CCC55CF|nr:DUF3368 domain-containing protein [Salegentibacter tibetensis]MBZ9728341.1 DUF3368 domain-containing protein [Salegentibacter tibetensis]